MECLRRLRKEKGLTQRELADDLNITQQSVYKYENNKSTPNAEILQIISDYFQVSIDDLVEDNIVDICPYRNYKNNNIKITDEERKIIYKYRRLTTADKKTFQRILDNIYESTTPIN